MSIPSEWQDKSKNKAEEILSEYYESYPLKTPIPIRSVIESYLGDVVLVNSLHPIFGEGVSAFAKKDMQLGWCIAVNGRECMERQRFSAAHELAHIVLFPPQMEEIAYCSTDNSAPNEKICDFFAGHLLMPEKFIRAYYKTHPAPYLGDIARAFKVSRQVAEIQLRLLGLSFRNKVGEGYIRF